MEYSLLGIIPARGGSKGLPRKNILHLNGIPLICHTINAALKSNIFDRIVVSTDDDEIKEVALRAGADVIDRPSSLATDNASSLDVIMHILNSTCNFSHFMLLQPTSPLRNSRHIVQAWNLYLSSKSDSVISVVETQYPPQKTLVDLEGKIIPLTKKEDLTSPRQNLPQAYLPNGAIYVASINNFLKNKDLFYGKIALFKMDLIDGLDIDKKEDLILAEKYLKKEFDG